MTIDRAKPLGAVVFLALLAVALSWPLVRQLGTALPGSGPGDNVDFVWNLWWMRHAGPSGFLRTDYILWPFGANLVLHTHTMPNAVIAATLFKNLTVVEAQNILVLMSVFLNGLAAHALAFDITRNRSASLAGASVFSSAPYFAAHIEGHFNLMIGWVIPTFILFFRRAIRRHRDRDAVVAGAALALVGYADYYYFVFCAAAVLCLYATSLGWIHVVRESRKPCRVFIALFTSLAVLLGLLIGWIHLTGGTTVAVGPVNLSLRGTFNARMMLWVAVVAAAAARWRFRFRPYLIAPDQLARPSVRIVSIAGAVFCIFALPIALPALRLIGTGDYVAARSFFRSAPRGVDVLALVEGNPRHPFFGPFVRKFNDRVRIDAVEGVAWMGVASIALAWLGLRRWPDRVERRTWGVLLTVFLIWALGPFLTVAGMNTAMVLPQTALRYVPLVSNARIPGRAMVIVYLSLAALSAMGLSARWPRSSLPAWIATALILFDYISAPIPMWQIDVPQVYQTLRARTDRGALLELPMGIRDGFGSRGNMDPGSPLFQTVHEHPVVGGFLARIPARVFASYSDDAVFGPLLRTSEGSAPAAALPDPGGFRDGLRSRGVRYVILRRSGTPPALASWVEAALGRFLIARDPGRELFDVAANN